MKRNKTMKIFHKVALTVLFFSMFAAFGFVSVPKASAEKIDLGGFELISFEGGKKVDLGEMSKGLPLYIVFSTAT